MSRPLRACSAHIYPDFSPQSLAPREHRFGFGVGGGGWRPSSPNTGTLSGLQWGLWWRRLSWRSQRSPLGARATLARIGLVISGARGYVGSYWPPPSRDGAVLGTDNPAGRAPTGRWMRGPGSPVSPVD